MLEPDNDVFRTPTGASGYALRRCDELIAWYERQQNRMRILDSILQTITILAAGTTAFAAAVEGWPKWAVVLPAVITSLTSGMNAVFRFRNKFVGFTIAAERLKSAKLRFKILSDPTAEARVLEFVDRVDDIVSAELAEWTALHKTEPAADQRPSVTAKAA